MKIFIYRAIQIIVELLLLPVFIFIASLSRYKKKNFDIGLGPEPLINNIYHKKALEKQGYIVETFVYQVYFITADFDFRADLIFRGFMMNFANYFLFAFAVLRYRCIYIYFNGGPLGFSYFLWHFEPLFYKIAKVKVVVMPYGGDVQEISRARNLLYKHSISIDYPAHRLLRKRIKSQIDIWTRNADHVISGCEWVDYMYHWDTLMLAHFSIDTEMWKPDFPGDQQNLGGNRKFRILHAPNHRNIKGTSYFARAIDELNNDGLNIELVLLERVPNSEIRKMMASVDVVADQLIIGWYAMFAIEAMAMEKPVLCYIREDLEDFYIKAGLISQDELPIIKCDIRNIKEKIRDALLYRDKLREIGRRSREYVIKHHSIDSIGDIFLKINTSLGLSPKKNAGV